MINVLKLKGRLKEKDYTQEEISRILGINPSTFNKKINDKDGEHLTIKEAEILKNVLEIPNSEIKEYFFAQELEDTQER